MHSTTFDATLHSTLNSSAMSSQPSFLKLAEQLSSTVDFPIESVLFAPTGIIVSGRSDDDTPLFELQASYGLNTDRPATQPQLWIVDSNVFDMPARRAALEAAQQTSAQIYVAFDAAHQAAFAVMQPILETPPATYSETPTLSTSVKFLPGTQRHAIDPLHFPDLPVLESIVRDILAHGDTLPTEGTVRLSEDAYTTRARLALSAHEQVRAQHNGAAFFSKAAGIYPITHLQTSLWVQRQEQYVYLLGRFGPVAVLDLTSPLENFENIAQNGSCVIKPYSTLGLLRFLKDHGVQTCLTRLDGGGDSGVISLEEWGMQPNFSEPNIDLNLPKIPDIHSIFFVPPGATIPLSEIIEHLCEKIPEENWWDNLGASGTILLQPFATDPDECIVIDMQENEDQDDEAYDDDEDEDDLEDKEKDADHDVVEEQEANTDTA